MDEPDAPGDVDVSDLDELEERVAAIFELPEAAQAPAFAKLRQRFPKAADALLRWERAAFEIDADRRDFPSVATAMRERPPTKAPERIGPYKILDVLGEGGMGTVYLAEQQEPVRRRVALKVIRSGMDSKDVMARFEAERQAVAMMSHPNIAKVLDAGATPDGQPYFALEHVPGVPITEYSDRQKLPLEARIELFQKVCRGVQHAHQKGVIHRDLKPGNILVQIRDGFAEPKIIDFGVAKAIQQRLTERTLYTEQGRILGTPEYMSPEQAEMSGLDIDTRSDIYSLGVLLYELLSGELPFDSSELRQAGYFEMQRKIREEDPPRPSTRCSTQSAELIDVTAARRRTDPRALAKALHGDLDWIVMRCLEKDPARRYQSASELAADLQRSLDDEPVEAGPPSAWYRFKKLLRKRRGPLAAVAAVFVALAVGLSVALWQWNAALASERAARLNEQRAVTNAERARDAEEETKQSLSTAESALRRVRALNLAGAAERAMDADPVVGLQLALKAVEIDRTPDTLSAVQTAMAEQYLYAECRGHRNTITCSDFAAEQGRVVTGSLDGTVRVWSEEGEQLVLLEQEGEVVHADFSADERQILTVSRRGRFMIARSFALDGAKLREIVRVGGRQLHIAVWDPRTSRLLVQYADAPRAMAILDESGSEIRQLGERQFLRSDHELFFSPEGHAVWILRGQLTIWRRDGSAPLVLRSNTESGSAASAGFYVSRLTQAPVAFDPRRELIATVHLDNVIRLWSWQGEPVAELREHTHTLKAVRFSPSGAQILTASGDGTARLWSRSGQRRAVLTPGGELADAKFVGSGRRVLTCGSSRLTLWTDTGRKIVRLASVGSVTSVDMCDLVGDLVLWCSGNLAQVWRLGGVTRAHLRGEGARPWFLARHPDGAVLCGSEDGRLFAWGRDGALIREFDSGEARPLYDVAASPDGSRVAAGAAGKVHVWDWRTAEKRFVLELKLPKRWPMPSPVSLLHWLRNGKIWAHTNARTAYLLDPETRTQELLFDRKVVVRNPPRDGRCQFGYSNQSADRSMIGVTDWSLGHVLLFDGDGRRLADFRPHSKGCTEVAFHRDGKRMATTSVDGSVKIWDLEAVLADPGAAEPLRTFSMPDAVDTAAFSPDGERLLIVTETRAYVTDMSGEVLFHFWPRGGASGYLTPALRFSADGRWIYGKAYDGLRRWPANETDLMQMAREWVDRLRVGHDLGKYEHLWVGDGSGLDRGIRPR